MLVFFLFFILSLQVLSCSNAPNNTWNIRFIKENCNSLLRKDVTLSAKYLGWNCPQTCKHPGLTRSDTCIEDSSDCIYLHGFGGLNPLKDEGSIHIFYGIVKKSPSGVCYIEVKKVK